MHDEPDPPLAVDQVTDHALAIGWVLDAVPGLAEDGVQHAGFLVQLDQDVPVMRVQIFTVEAFQALPQRIR